MFRKWALFLAVCSVFFWNFVPVVTFAQAIKDDAGQPTCSCWCGTDEGAIGLGTTTQTACKSGCLAKKATYLICAKDPSGWPENDVQCFTQEQCENKETDFGYNGDWDAGPNPNCPATYRYCFNKSGTEEIELGVPIGDITTVKDLETYLSKVFSWMLSAAVVITIVFVMIGGIQYALGGLAKDQIDKGKKRIQNGVIGLVLLFTSAMIVQTVNPQLLKLNVPKLPMVKTIVLANGISCNDYLLKKYTLSDSVGKCGDVSDVFKNEKGVDVAAGTQCVWRTCGKAEEQCLMYPGGSICTRCYFLVEGGENNQGVAHIPYNLKPSPQLCGQFPKTVTTYYNQPSIKQCGWTKDSDVNSGYNFKALRTGSCAEIQINCASIRSCDDYDDQVRVHNYTSGGGRGLELEYIIYESSILCGGGCGNFGLQTICEENPCSVLNGGKVETDCKYDTDAYVKNDCIEK